ncbi:uncharacterized protein BDR25DRAFT_293643 [Lindgomyces ingoldianus]|uniref:Uncharacterized protein n=1 Tax=Lindgomyces ingoldianus TaxID=673940 RepID=A0ACB6QJE0_9PLEO|nr:uncharacterized protein BDR25DRAFT_293643 [Lindgomyces ingoldianus]KAF2466252.1 hypothetical protein BDR25DRAFT_293643 [Lindgomyces ingoldianus]
MLQVVVVCTIILTLFFTASHFKSDLWRKHLPSIPDQVPQSFRPPPSLSFKNQPPKPKPANSTLDFQEIFYISMPYRTDRQDALSLLAAVSGIKLTMIPGIDPKTIHHKAEPHMIGGNNMTATPALGCWRAHANAWKHIIDNNIETALIVEDDIDWDVNIKDIMGLWGWQLRYNNTIRWGRENVEKGWKEDCPYGCDWDELWMGQCGNAVNKERLDLHWRYSDPNGPDIGSADEGFQKEFKDIWKISGGDGMRVTSATYGPLCTMGYAVSRMGAMRMLYHIGGWHGMGLPVDNEIAFKTEDGYISGYTMTPPAFTAWRVGGSRDTDNALSNNNAPTTDEGNEKGWSKGLKSSVRKHLAQVLDKNYWKDMENERR